MSSFLGHRVKSRTSLHAESNDVIETTNGTLATNKKKKKFAEFNVGDEVEVVEISRAGQNHEWYFGNNKKKKKFAEFNVGDEVEAVIKRKTKFGTFCDINAEKLVLISGPVPFKRLLKFQERVKAKIKTIDLEKRQVAIEIPDLEQLVQGRSSPTSATPAQTKPKVDGVKVKGGSISMDISGLELAKAVKAKIKTIDLEKRQVAIEIPDLEQLVQGRSSPTSATPAQTKPKVDGVKVKGGSISMDISGLELANVDVNYEKGTVQISVKSK
eukprot:CAMPEP_0172791768 /NCGR_PEP_ID=MMETSP1074-20121228/208635_1 /TAXON_ID=2916 /ORGANISM="Ceratium fusus, Strain PA161109" /LENGTH=269 /DNA_ID=CAMNT_0013628829 /DNA_START=225 /DNA_END=1036 /DNA_ORIENTATION=-